MNIENTTIAVDEETAEKLRAIGKKMVSFVDRHSREITVTVLCLACLRFLRSMRKLDAVKAPKCGAEVQELMDILKNHWEDGSIGGDIVSTIKGLLDENRFESQTLVVLGFDSDKAAARFASLIANL